MEVEEIRDGDSLRVWLEAPPKQTEADREQARRWAVAIAHRAAMRVLPIFWSGNIRKAKRNEDLTELSVLRALLISGSAAVCSIPEIIAAAAAAAHAADTAAAAHGADAAAHAAAHAAHSAAQTAHAADAADAAARAAARASLWKSIRHDCAALLAEEPPERHPLWLGENPLEDLWSDTRAQLLAHEDGWKFWVDWYDASLEGAPIGADPNAFLPGQPRTALDWESHWDLLTKVALIPPEDWDKGADHVNARIAEIVTERDGLGPKATPPPKAATVQRLKAAVEMNGPVLALQLRALQEVAAQEAERIRGVNSLDPEARAGLLEALGKLRDAAEEILRLLPDTGAPSDAEAEQILGWGEVLKSSARQWNEEAKRFVARKPDRETVAFAGRLVLAAAVAGPLSLMGAAPFAAVAGGAILLGGRLDVPKVFKSLRSGNPPT